MIKSTTLELLEMGQEAHILGFVKGCKEEVKRRLLDLGFVQGASITVENLSPLGDPTAYLIHNTQIALRKEDAQYVLITIH